MKAEGEEFNRLMTELRRALHEHHEETRKLLVQSYPRDDAPPPGKRKPRNK